MRDVMMGIRGVLRRPLLSMAVILTFGIGIGANTAIFSVVDGVLLRDLPYPEPERLLRVRTHFRGAVSNSSSEANFRDYREQIESVESITAYSFERLYIGDGVEPRYVLGIEASHEFFDVLGVTPQMGRGFVSDDERPDNAIAVIGHGFWQSHFAGRADVVGRTVNLDERSYTVVGVTPKGFTFPSREVELWVPAYFDPQRPDARENHFLGVVGRLADGATLAQGQAEFAAYGERVVREFPDNYKTFEYGVSAVRLLDHQVADARAPLLLLAAAVMCVLLIACANVANLLLVRAEARSRELAIRSALGASRARVVRQLLAEAMILAAAGGVVGLLLAVAGTRSLLALAGGAVPRVGNVSVDGRVLVVTAVVSLLAGLVAGALPALRAGGSDLRGTLLSGGRGLAEQSARNRTRRLLVAAEVALAVMLVACAGLMIRSLAELGSVDPGFRIDNVLAVHVALPEGSYQEPERVVAFFAALDEKARALPGVREAGVASRVPLLSGLGWWSFQLRGCEVETIGEAPTTYVQRASPGYFRALGISAAHGRLFTDGDGPGQPLVAVVNESFVRQFFDGGPALGEQLSLWNDEWQWVEIVGVAPDIRHRELADAAAPMLYLPHAQPRATGDESPRSMWLFVHAEPEAVGVAESVRQVVHRLDSSVPVTRVETMAGIHSAAFADREFPTVLIGLFGAIALVLAAVGIYAVVAFAAGQRTREIGIRLAVGAVARDVRRLVVMESLVPVVSGLAVGLAGFFVASGLLRSLLFNVAPGDPLTVACVAALLLAIAAAASYIPAFRASRIDPAAVLRSE